MTLRKQLLLVGLLTLCVPVLFLILAAELEETLRQSQKVAHIRLAESLSSALSRELPATGTTSEDNLWIPRTQITMVLDGYASDWEHIPWLRSSPGRPETPPWAGTDHRVRLVLDGTALWLFLQWRDDQLYFNRPGRPLEETDHVRLEINTLSGISEELILAPEGVGRFEGTGKGTQLRTPLKWQAVWQQTGDVQQLELRLPLLDLPSSISLLQYDADPARRSNPFLDQLPLPENYQPPVQTIKGRTLYLLGQPAENMPVHAYSPELAAQLEELTPAETRLTLYSPNGTVIATVDKTLDLDTHNSPLLPDIIRRLVLLFVDRESPEVVTYPRVRDDDTGTNHQDPGNPHPRSTSGVNAVGRHWPDIDSPRHTVAQWQQPGNSRLATVVTYSPVLAVQPGSSQPQQQDQAKPPTPAAPKVKAWLKLHQPMPEMATLSNAAILSSLQKIVLLVSLIVALLLGYALWLSFRIRRLNRQMKHALDPGAGFVGRITISGVNDELSELASELKRTLTQLRSYSEYMEGFASKLSHECRTPLAIITSSLSLAENQQGVSGGSDDYLKRASDGAARLSRILTAMRQATQLESSIQQYPVISYQVSPVLRELFEAYRDVTGNIRLSLEIAPAAEAASVAGHPDLLAQALDKLFENARDFTPDQGTIALSLRLSEDHRRCLIDMINNGPPISEALLPRLTQPFVTSRATATSDKGFHLGLGLNIVTLIAHFHQGRLDCENVANGVRFSLQLPLQSEH